MLWLGLRAWVRVRVRGRVRVRVRVRPALGPIGGVSCRSARKARVKCENEGCGTNLRRHSWHALHETKKPGAQHQTPAQRVKFAGQHLADARTKRCGFLQNLLTTARRALATALAYTLLPRRRATIRPSSALCLAELVEDGFLCAATRARVRRGWKIRGPVRPYNSYAYA